MSGNGSDFGGSGKSNTGTMTGGGSKNTARVQSTQSASKRAFCWFFCLVVGGPTVILKGQKTWNKVMARDSRHPFTSRQSISKLSHAFRWRFFLSCHLAEHIISRPWHCGASSARSRFEQRRCFSCRLWVLGGSLISVRMPRLSRLHATAVSAMSKWSSGLRKLSTEIGVLSHVSWTSP